MRSRRYRSRAILAAAVVIALVVPNARGAPSALADETPAPAPGGCAGMTGLEENHSSIRLQVDQPATGAEAAVDEHGNITVGGILHKQATMVDVSDDQVISSSFVLGGPPAGVADWAASWTTSLRPPHLGANELCTRAVRDPHRSARILRSFTVVDRIPPSAVPGLTVGTITATAATVTWGPASDNYGLAGYDVSVDSGPPSRTVVGIRTFTITGLAPSTDHTVSVVAVDLAGNRSTTPATATFTTHAAPPPPSGELTFVVTDGGASASWHPVLASDATYKPFLDSVPLEEFPFDRYCYDANGNPANPCTAQDTVTYTVSPLESDRLYGLQVFAVDANGTLARTLTGSFQTAAGTLSVPAAATQMTASESSRCAGSGGDFYVAPNSRATVPIPPGSTQIFTGCYQVPNSSCIDRFLPPSGNKAFDCDDDMTRLLFTTAPVGRGPVIGSLDELAVGEVEPITWCANGSCAVLLAPPTEAAEIAVAAPAAVAATSWLVIAGTVIGLAVAVFALLEIIFPGKIGFSGLIEYPMHFDTNFDTFDNWTADEGEWFNSLKIFAEVVKTTKEVTDRNHLPFAWNDAEEQILKRYIDGACSAQRGLAPGTAAGCNDDVAIYVPGGTNYVLQPMKETGTHIVAAMGDGVFPRPPARVQWFYPARSIDGQAAKNAGFDRRWYYTDSRFNNNACTQQPNIGKTCDEFPFWVTNQAVTLSGTLADVKLVPSSESLPQGTDISGFYGQCHVDDNEHFIVLPIKEWVQANGPSFGFRVSQSGADLCLKPRPLP